MGKIYINGIGSVSAQDSTNSADFNHYQKLTNNVVHAFKPNYRDYIKPALIRRMSNGVKMGVVASSIALKEAGLEIPNAIITGSGMGCLKDSEKFLKNIIDDDEQFLTPTSFIQSTHNTVGAQIALGLNCKAYNVTYVHGSSSFESSLIDAQLMLQENKNDILVGGVDELGDYTTQLYKLIEHIKKESSMNIDSKGSIISEGAHFFVLQNKTSVHSYAELVDVAIYNHINTDMVENKLMEFLFINKLDVSDIDAVILGLNDDIEHDSIYNNFRESIFKNIPQLKYKHLVGEYNTVTGFGMWMACHLIRNQDIPKSIKLNDCYKPSMNKILLYNQYRGRNYSFTLLSSC